jgi:hypothetical protein
VADQTLIKWNIYGWVTYESSDTMVSENLFLENLDPVSLDPESEHNT